MHIVHDCRAPYWYNTVICLKNQKGNTELSGLKKRLYNISDNVFMELRVIL